MNEALKELHPYFAHFSTITQIYFFKVDGQQKIGSWYVKIAPSSLLLFGLLNAFVFRVLKKLTLESFCQIFSYFYGEENFWKSLVYWCHPTFLNVMYQKNQSTLCQLYLTNKLYCSTFIFSFKTLFLLLLPLSLISLTIPNASFPSANIL